MADFQETEAEFESIAKELELGIKNLSKNRRDVAGTVALLRNRLTRAKQILRSYKLDFRELPKGDQKPFQEKANEYEEKLKKLENDLNWAERDDGSGSPAAATVQSNGVQTQNEETTQILNQAKNIQKKDLDAVRRIEMDVANMNQAGTSTLEEMAVQEEQMKRIQKDMEEVDSNLKLATRQMRAFARKMATDKIIMGLILLIVIAIIFVIIYTIVRPKSNPKVADRIIPE
ncbi:hypothetical protein DICPUDRAFT_75576 [Dictyostelium purpureum]|uniref:t-SNARE coiled-coil homology domain-containing protein n=1 Tax=Dictyostelium purpureum TaxID=5786 RepID=F0ZB21_DICPU|nr:uncharacterized protein DICPUDRAFT_75576 [Dictyostelium purpureum]EGC38842.1 hypothetical protein DICPUDRAFT_75576 [Dictyostelium purpureum]|eukprot:XP_003284636.1 hypothetical protein DICPUDRAFT_75576 [Dictyostelium purpureum]